VALESAASLRHGAFFPYAYWPKITTGVPGFTTLRRSVASSVH
jgi:hypothetical protein